MATLYFSYIAVLFQHTVLVYNLPGQYETVNVPPDMGKQSSTRQSCDCLQYRPQIVLIGTFRLLTVFNQIKTSC
jgi:hypothetical protein